MNCYDGKNPLSTKTRIETYLTIRNIIFHCLTKGVKVGLVDFIITKFTPLKGLENVLEVASSVRETAELLRITKIFMYKQNSDLAKTGVIDIADY